MKFWILLITIAAAFCGRCKNHLGTNTVTPPATTSLLTTTEYTPEPQCSLQDMKSWDSLYANSSTVEHYYVPLEDHFKITNATTIQLEFGDQMNYIYVVKLACKVESRYNDSYTSLNISNSTFVYSPGALPPIMFFNVKCDNGKWICGGMESSWPTNYTTLLTITKAKIILPTPTTEIPTTTTTRASSLCSLDALKKDDYCYEDSVGSCRLVPLADYVKLTLNETSGITQLSFIDADYEELYLTYKYNDGVNSLYTPWGKVQLTNNEAFFCENGAWKVQYLTYVWQAPESEMPQFNYSNPLNLEYMVIYRRL